MKILLSNDDGIDAAGIRALADILSPEYEVYVSAPEGQRSGYSHSCTYFSRVNRAWKREIPGAKAAWAVEATPADCVYYGINAFMEEAPDLVISGINQGPNMADDCIYSGTVGAAGEAMVHHIPAIAVSLDSFDSQDFRAAAAFVKEVIPVFMADEDRYSFILNINVPAGEIKGVKVTRLENGREYTKDVSVREEDGCLYLTCRAKPVGIHSTVIGDVTAVAEGYISLTPLMHDMTHHESRLKMHAYKGIKFTED